MPAPNFFFQIGAFFAGSRTTMPPSADTCTLRGSVVSPIRTFRAGGSDRAGRGETGGAGDCEVAPAKAKTIDSAPAMSEGTLFVIGAASLSRQISRTGGAAPAGPRGRRPPAAAQAKELGAQGRALREGPGKGRGD